MTLLTTERLVLRPPALSDLDAFHALWSDSAVTKHIKRHPHTTLAESETRLSRTLARHASGDIASWVFTHAGGPMLGFVGLCRFVKEHRRAEVVYELLPTHWGKGYVREALLEVVDHAFDTLMLHRLEGHADVDNARSIRVLEQCGFSHEARIRENFLFDGRFHDTVIYGRVANDHDPEEA